MSKPTVETQEAFNRIARHLLEQGEPALDQDGMCRYRIPGSNHRCAIGGDLPDNCYHPDIEGLSVIDFFYAQKGEILHRKEIEGELLTVILRIRKRYENVDFEVLSGLQEIHDDYLPKQWAEKLRLLAEKHGLDSAVVDQWEKGIEEELIGG